MASKKEKRFGGLKQTRERQEKKESSYGYLSLPKGVNLFKEHPTKPRERINLDFMLYKVTDPKHLDLNTTDDPLGCKVGNYWYTKPFRVHRNIGPEKNSLICPTTIGKPCPVCEYKYAELDKGTDYEDVKDLNFSTRNLYAIIPSGHKDYKEDIHVWNVSNYCFEEKFREYLKEHPQVEEDFPDPEFGYTIKVKFLEKKFGKNSYAEASENMEHERREYDPEILDEVPNLDEMLIIKSYKEIESLFLGIDEDEPKSDNEEEEEEERPTKRRKTVSKSEDEEEDRPVRRRRTEPEPEEEEEEEEEEEDRPVKRQPTSRRKATDEEPPFDPDEEDEEEEEEEEEEQRPVRRRGKPESKPAASKSAKSKECPSGHEFGEQWDDFKECETCPLYNDCGDEYEKEYA